MAGRQTAKTLILLYVPRFTIPIHALAICIAASSTEALVDWVTVAISAASFLLVAFLKRDVALVAIGAMVSEITYVCVRALAL